MIRYKLIGDNDIRNPVQSLLKTRGIEGDRLQTFFQAGCESVIDPFRLNNMKEACDVVHQNLGKKIFTLVDCDTDGFTSAAMLVNFLEGELKQEVDYYVHSDKTHGLQAEVMDKILDGGYELVYFADAGSNDVEQCKTLKEEGIKVVILDHHESCENPYAVVVNNQLSKDYSNKAFSGAGIVWKFISAYKMLYGSPTGKDAKDYLDLLALGNTADAMDMRSDETRYLMLQGFKNVKNAFFKAMCESNAYSMKNKVTPMSVAWYVAPTVNAVCRFGEIEDKRELFAAMLDRNAALMVPSDKRGAAKDEEELLTTRVVRHSKNVKKHQDDAVKLAQTQIEKMIEERGLLEHKLLFIQVDENAVKPEIAGLLANKLASKYQQPTLIGRLTESGLIAGSGRNFNHSPVENFRETLLETGLVDFAQGHASAFGFAIEKDKVDMLILEMDKVWKEMTFTQEYPVDFEIDTSTAKDYEVHNFLMMLGEVSDKGLWGNGLSEPYVVFKNVRIGGDAKLLSPNKKPTLKIEKPYCTFMKFGSSAEEVNSFIPSGFQGITADFIGRVNLNEFNGRITPQLFIEAYDIRQNWDF